MLLLGSSVVALSGLFDTSECLYVISSKKRWLSNWPVLNLPYKNFMRAMKKQSSLFLFFFLAFHLAAAPFYVRINGTTDYPADATGEADFQGRTQYKASAVALSVNDIITVYDAGENVAWAITALDPYGAYLNFTASASGITCDVEGCYDIYIKTKYNRICWTRCPLYGFYLHLSRGQDCPNGFFLYG